MFLPPEKNWSSGCEPHIFLRHAAYNPESAGSHPLLYQIAITIFLVPKE
jgi:hypothetical protein